MSILDTAPAGICLRALAFQRIIRKAAADRKREYRENFE